MTITTTTIAPAWRGKAACQGIAAEIFFPDPEEEGVEAKAICDRCGVKAACLEWALTHREKEGVWGGATERERRRILRQRRRSA